MTSLRAHRIGWVLAVLVASSSSSFADEVPVSLQVQLLSKMVTSIPQLQPAGGDPLKIVVVYPGETVSRGAQSIANAIKQVGRFGPHATTVELMSSNDPSKIAATSAQLIYIANEVDSNVAAAIVDAVDTGASVTASALSDHSKAGVVIGFQLVEARPRVLVNLKQARKQNIEFKNKFLTFAVIVEK